MSDEDCRIFKILSYAVTDGKVFLPDEKVADELLQTCLELYNRDNVCTTLRNSKGLLCSTYPGKLIIPLKQKNDEKSDTYPDQSFVANKEFEELVIKGRFARTRGRFPVPVLLIGDKFVCRSSTLARSPEIYTRTGYQYFIQGEASAESEGDKYARSNGNFNGESTKFSNGEDEYRNGVASALRPPGIRNRNLLKKQKLMQSSIQSVNGTPGQNTEWLLDKMRKTDIDILHALRVNLICDLMVENKKVKYGLHVTSSEKVDRQNRYGDFHLLSIPYPGCEFFADYSQNNYTGVGLKFDWKQNFVDAELQLPENIANLNGIKWKDYMEWDLITLTQNYLKLLLKCLANPSSTGLLLHCISGWDRTPLFISLLRLSLWADGLLHQSLNAEEVVYLTLAYDWLLFSHQFSDRIDKNEEILHFCFEFLKDMTSREYSLLPLIEGNTSSFATADTDDMFAMDNISIDADRVSNLENCNGNEGSLKEAGFEEIHNHIDCSELKNLHGKTVQQNDDPLLNLEDVETCLNCVVSNVSCSCNSVSESHLSEKEKGLRKVSSNGHMATCSSFSTPAAVLPLHTSDNISTKSKSPTHQKTESSMNQVSGDRDVFSEFDFSPPPSALSSSYESAKHEIFSVCQGCSKSENVKLSMSSSLDISEESTRQNMPSNPIPVPLKRTKGSFVMHTPVCSSLGSSLSNAAHMGEPGSSWQMVSTSPQDISSAVETNSSISSAQLSHNNSFSFAINGAYGDLPCLRLKLEKRREKLKMAHNVMLPAYSAVVEKQKQQKEQSSFSTIMGTLAHLVKRV